jgi:hypothetical protein
MATSMGLFRRLRSAVSTRDELLQELAVLAGRNRGLVDRMRRHANVCTLQNIKQGVASIAENESAHVKTLDAILSDNSVWARLPEAPLHDGASNWERLNGDLILIGSLAAELRLAAVKWEPVDQTIGDTLLQMAVEDGERETELRKLAIKCDPQAFD